MPKRKFIRLHLADMAGQQALPGNAIALTTSKIERGFCGEFHVGDRACCRIQFTANPDDYIIVYESLEEVVRICDGSIAYSLRDVAAEFLEVKPPEIHIITVQAELFTQQDIACRSFDYRDASQGDESEL